MIMPRKSVKHFSLLFVTEQSLIFLREFWNRSWKALWHEINTMCIPHMRKNKMYNCVNETKRTGTDEIGQIKLEHKSIAGRRISILFSGYYLYLVSLYI